MTVKCPHGRSVASAAVSSDDGTGRWNDSTSTLRDSLPMGMTPALTWYCPILLTADWPRPLRKLLPTNEVQTAGFVTERPTGPLEAAGGDFSQVDGSDLLTATITCFAAASVSAC